METVASACELGLTNVSDRQSLDRHSCLRPSFLYSLVCIRAAEKRDRCGDSCHCIKNHRNSIYIRFDTFWSRPADAPDLEDCGKAMDTKNTDTPVYTDERALPPSAQSTADTYKAPIATGAALSETIATTPHLSPLLAAGTKEAPSDVANASESLSYPVHEATGLGYKELDWDALKSTVYMARRIGQDRVTIVES